MRTQSGGTDVCAAALRARERPLIGVEPLVQFQVDELRERQIAQVARVGPLSVVQPKMSLQVAGGAEPFLADVALVRTLP